MAKIETKAEARFADGECVSHETVQSRLRITTVRATKKFIEEMEIPYTPAAQHWWMDGGDIRRAIKAKARSHAEHRAMREGRKERKPESMGGGNDGQH